MKITHLATDEKFIGHAHDTFEDAFPDCNSFLIFGPKEWKYIPVDNANYKSVKKRYIPHGYFWNELKNSDVVIIHFLHIYFAWLVLFLPKKVNVVWIGWGGDYYSRIFPFYPANILLAKTQRYCGEAHKGWEPLHWALKRVHEFIFWRAIKKIKIFSPVLESEHKVLEAYYPRNRIPSYAPWNYGELERHFISGIENKRVLKSGVVIGNSAFPSNNHLEVFDVLAKHNVSRPILLPLAYGDVGYKEHIKSVAAEVFGDSVNVVDQFMPVEQYNRLLLNYDSMIINACRQQALGNIIVALYIGAKVFVREESPVYAFFKNKGVTIFTVEMLEKDLTLLDLALTDEQVEKAREALLDCWGRKSILLKTKQLINAVLG
ncbi:TDP-N-acetylfucosamine:lipid II N-acetylfucosaminyltransferase [Saccharophagus degradans]|uniref:TDP-N-acetylfucosamine:lipid II N-acetylfucosaminyltransferase n=1 Tax=Saccharophagus degradans TaxID=86304 RepID=UPI00247805D5|nr:TDP-N-acetylfucosamine:lipid II N-acetylfucosaminyltransferase [Saccharophagus degradans]WGP00386.1 TDP-N-acetylfucosamine:lipid II N-acetylfucosaminyltransferase [Saccharophagus degradans]